jgi:hypothetical protein
MLYASGVGAVIDLPGLSVLVRGLDYWDYSAVLVNSITEDRLLRSVRGLLGTQVEGLRTPPWMADEGDYPAGPLSPLNCGQAGQLGEMPLTATVVILPSRPIRRILFPPAM